MVEGSSHDHRPGIERDSGHSDWGREFAATLRPLTAKRHECVREGHRSLPLSRSLSEPMNGCATGVNWGFRSSNDGERGGGCWTGGSPREQSCVVDGEQWQVGECNGCGLRRLALDGGGVGKRPGDG